MTTVRALAFGDEEGGQWGAAWVHGAGNGMLAVRMGPQLAVLDVRLDHERDGERWLVEGDGVSLELTPSGQATRTVAAEGALEAVNQLCVVAGALTLTGTAHEVSCPGWHGVLESTIQLDRIESFRQVCAWFDQHEGLALTALRPRKAHGQEADVVAAAVLDAEPAPPVADPRLSTTYSAAGIPARAGLELWLAEDSSESDEGEAASQYPRRAAGESIGAALDWTVEGFDLHAEPLRWHSRGHDGAGVYLLGRRR